MPRPRLSLSGVGEGVCADTIVAVEMIRIARVSESAVKTGNAFHPFFVVFFMAYSGSKTMLRAHEVSTSGWGPTDSHSCLQMVRPTRYPRGGTDLIGDCE